VILAQQSKDAKALLKHELANRNKLGIRVSKARLQPAAWGSNNVFCMFATWEVFTFSCLLHGQFSCNLLLWDSFRVYILMFAADGIFLEVIYSSILIACLVESGCMVSRCCGIIFTCGIKGLFSWWEIVRCVAFSLHGFSTSVWFYLVFTILLGKKSGTWHVLENNVGVLLLLFFVAWLHGN
jgi:hypothetical protein